MGFKNVKIGCDIDGVVSSPYCLIPLFNELFNKDLKDEDWTQYEVAELYGVEIDWTKMSNEFDKRYLDSIDIRKNVDEQINELNQYYEVHFITARGDTEYKRGRTEEYLLNNNLSHIPLHMLGSHDKLTKAKELGITYMIEDRGETALQFAKAGITTFLIDTNYNQDFEHDNIIRVFEWEEILEHLIQY